MSDAFLGMIVGMTFGGIAAILALVVILMFDLPQSPVPLLLLIAGAVLGFLFRRKIVGS
ncbi:hypothetical protein NKH48_03295 [Mesorhizobium sp. M1233]|uniref:hypothetical protein n=1 Tax=Mesorhizobium sp. M1233 TaxID=2957072 RepID=UPI00333BB1C9